MIDPSKRNDPGANPAQPRRTRPAPRGRTQPLIRTAKDYWIMFRERWYLGLIPAAIVAGVLVIQQIRKPRDYESAATLIFERQAPVVNTPTFQNGAGEITQANLSTFVEQMRSTSFRERVIATLTPEETEIVLTPYQEPDLPPAAQPTIRSIVLKAVKLIPSRTTPIVSIEAKHRDPDAAEILANRYARCFIEYTLDSSDSRVVSQLEVLQDEERKAQLRLEEANARLLEYRRTHNAYSLTENQNIIAARLDNVSQQLNEARQARIALEGTVQLVDEYLRSKRDVAQISYIANFRNVAALVAELDNLRAEKSVKEQKYLENWPEMQELTAKIDATAALLDKNVKDAMSELRTAYAEARHQEGLLEAEYRRAEEEAFALSEIEGAYRVLEEQAATAQKTYQQIVDNRAALVSNKSLANIVVNILDRAQRGYPSSSDLQTAIVQASFLGIALLVGIPIGLGMLDSRLKAAWEIEQFLGKSLLGEVPAISGVGRKERPHIMARELDHSASEAFRGLFGQLQLNSTVEYPKLVMITSTLPSEGKSVIANNLAATFAGHGKKTLLVDCDFRRPNLHVYYGKDNACGIVRWLNAGGTISDHLEDDPDLGILPLKENFFLLRAGGESRRATELFEIDAFHRLMVALRQQFDVVLVDTPPIGVFPDSMLLSRMIDEIVYVCRFNTVNRSKIRKSIERLRTSRAVFSGIVLNALPSGKQSAYYDYYGYGANETKRYKAYYAQRR